MLPSRYASLYRFLSQPLSKLNGIGPFWAQRFATLGVRTFWDLLTHLPRGHHFYTTCLPVCPPPTLDVRLLVMPRQIKQGKTWAYETQILDPLHGMPTSHSITLVFFQKPKYPVMLHKSYIAQGVMKKGFSGYVMDHPDITWGKAPLKDTFEPVYSVTKGLSSKVVSRFTKRVLENYPDTPEWLLAQEPFDHEKWPCQKTCFQELHFPENPVLEASTTIWQRRLAYDELVAQNLAFLYLQTEHRRMKSAPCYGNASVIEAFLAQFGHALTPSQAQTWSQIQQDLASCVPMMRLVHGDVGSGKTILAFLGLVQVACSGKRACFLVPTEILAQQHTAELKRYLEPLGMSVSLLTGSRKDKDLGSIIVGTHALFQDKVVMDTLGLVAIDEQHRFGVLQRLSLMRKGTDSDPASTPSTLSPHMLFLSATPIPRTLEMMVSGYGAISRIERRPESIPVHNYLVGPKKIPELYQWIAQKMDQGESSYWVCPLIETEENQEGELMFRAQDLQTIFHDKVAVLHGRMSWKEKEKTLDGFRSGATPLLVSTTVVEVGVHVPQATIMVIEHCQKFGLAQLHQLRGRVGRGGVPGHCFFLYKYGLSDVSRERLSIIRSSNDGFFLAQEDLRLRGPGHLWGLAQSGFGHYRFFDPSAHQDMMDQSKATAEHLWHHHPEEAQLLLKMFGHHHPDLFGAG